MPINEAFEVDENDRAADKIAKDEVEERETWETETHFLMSCIAMSVGLGNIWRFPFTAYENGGGAFLIPYLIVVIFIGRPLYLLEMCLGQFSSKANTKNFELLAPVLKGVAYGQIFTMVLGSPYQCSILAISSYYLFHSFTSNLPWAECLPEWEDDPVTCVPSNRVNISNFTVEKYRSSSELWFERVVLKEKIDISDGIGVPDWQLSCYLLLTWAILFVISSRGIKSSGKASYFLALFPYVVLIALLIRAVTLEGSTKGILYFFRPQWDKILTAKVWFSAITQCFLSLNVGSGAIITYASYNTFKQNIYRDALIVSTIDTMTSLIAGITTFSILGNLAHELGVEVTQVISSGGTRLTFVSYPDAIAKFKSVPWLFSIMFFFMLNLLGIGSLTAAMTSICRFVKDKRPTLKQWRICFVVSICGCLLGLPYVTPGGQFIMILIDFFGVTFIFFLLATLEVVTIVWWYGLENFCHDVEFMMNKNIGAYWKLCWGVLSPCLMIIVLIYFFATLEELKNGVREFPDFVLGTSETALTLIYFVLAIGWCILALGMSQLIVWWIAFLYKNRKLGIRQAFLNSLSTKSWRPCNNDDYEQWLKYKSSLYEEDLKDRRSWLRKRINFLFNVKTRKPYC